MFDFADIFTAAGLVTLGQIILIDLTMAGDNVVIMGTLTSGLPEKERRRVIMLGVGMALVFLIGFALIATQLLHFTGLVLAGGLLLHWVAYNMYRELRHAPPVVADDPDTLAVEGPPRSKTFLQAASQVTLVARLVQRYRWIAWGGLLMILYVAGKMIYDGVVDEHYGILHLIL